MKTIAEERLSHYLCWRFNSVIHKFEMCEKWDNDDDIDFENWKTGNYYPHTKFNEVSDLIRDMNKILHNLNNINDRMKNELRESRQGNIN